MLKSILPQTILITTILLYNTRISLSWSCHNPKSTTSLQASTSISSEQENAVGPTCTTVSTKDVLSLESIRSSLIRQEETIVFALIERSQYRTNPIVYQKGGFGDLGTPLGATPTDDDELLSFCEYMMLGTEILHWSVRRYTSPEENAFFPERLPKDDSKQILSPLDYPSLLDESIDNNFSSILYKRYVSEILPSIALEGDDEQHGSSALGDINVLQALSKRVHYGKFVAESKYRSDPQEYQRLVDNNDVDGVMKLLTNAAVEKKVLRRAKLKAATYGREPLLADYPSIDENENSSTTSIAAAAAAAVVAAVDAISKENQEESNTKVDPAVIESVYKDIIIPLTKIIEVAYLFRRCGKEPPKGYTPDTICDDWLRI